MTAQVLDFDYLILGSGIAGLAYALRVAEHGEVAIVTKRRAQDSATDWAQGGIAAVVDPEDSFDAHVVVSTVSWPRHGRSACRCCQTVS